MIGAARAHVERRVLDAFVDKVATLEDGDTKVALGLLCDLFALSTIEADRAWFMEHGRLSSQRSKAISREVNDLCRRSARSPAAWSTPSAYRPRCCGPPSWSGEGAPHFPGQPVKPVLVPRNFSAQARVPAHQ